MIGGYYGNPLYFLEKLDSGGNFEFTFGLTTGIEYHKMIVSPSGELFFLGLETETNRQVVERKGPGILLLKTLLNL